MLKWFTDFWKIERSRRLSFIFGALIIMGVLLISIGTLSTLKITPYRTYTNKNYGFSIKFPSYWKPVHPKGGAIIVFVAPLQNDLDTVSENFNISIKDMPQAMTIERVSDTIVNQVTGTFGQQIIISEKNPVMLAGRAGYRITFAGYDVRVSNPNPIQYTAVWTIVGSRVFILTFTGQQRDFPFYEKKVNTMINSFKLFTPEVRAK